MQNLSRRAEPDPRGGSSTSLASCFWNVGLIQSRPCSQPVTQFYPGWHHCFPLWFTAQVSARVSSMSYVCPWASPSDAHAWKPSQFWWDVSWALWWDERWSLYYSLYLTFSLFFFFFPHSAVSSSFKSRKVVEAKSESPTLIPGILIKKLKLEDSTSAAFSNSGNQWQNVKLERGRGANWPTEQFCPTGCGGDERWEKKKKKASRDCCVCWLNNSL